ncbi:MAG TPA: hypothetical protein DCR93_07665 [Cytophagales bacterium]|nr:hypothetical protein [Cytophagales bacterium]
MAANQAYGGAIAAPSGTLNVFDSELSGNSARGVLSPFGASSGHGGAVASGWWTPQTTAIRAKLVRCLLVGNYANSFLGKAYGGAVISLPSKKTGTPIDGWLVIDNCTFTENYAQASSDAYHSRAGALHYPLDAADTEVWFSTFEGNWANPLQGTPNGKGGAFFVNQNTLWNHLTVKASVFEGNYATEGNQWYTNLTQSQLGNNPLISGGYNVFHQAFEMASTNGIFWSRWSQNPSDLQVFGGLRPLKDNGGPTHTMAPSCNSSARGLATLSIPGYISTSDQQGVARPQGNADAGAYQSEPLDVNFTHNLPTARTCYNKCLNIEWEGVPGYTYRWTFVESDGSYQVYTSNSFEYTTPGIGRGVQVWVDIYDQSGCYQRVNLGISLKKCGGGTFDCGPGGISGRGLTEELIWENPLQLAYPNPTLDWVRFHPTTEVSQVTAVDAQGRVRTLLWSTQQRGVNLSELPAGLYVLQLQDGTGQILETHRVQKQ